MATEIQTATPLAALALTWLGGYVIHSTLLLALALLLGRFLSPRRADVMDIVWKAALLGGLVTASFQTLMPLTPALGRVTLAPAMPDRPTFATDPHMAMAPLPAHSPGLRAVSPPTPTAAAGSSSWQSTLLFGLAGGAGIGLLLLVLSHRRLSRRLATRRDVGATEPMVTTVRALEADAHLGRPVRVTVSGVLEVPISFAMPQPEICVPRRAVDELTTDAQRAVVAHELAHLTRRDPAWLLGFRTLEALLFFQPLNRLARRRWQEVSEYLCDDWAATTTRAPLALARCLTDVATWLGPAGSELTVAAMASRGSALGRRVERLIEAAPRHRRPRGLGLACVLALVIAGLSAPGVRFVVSADEATADARVDRQSAAAPASPSPAEPPAPPAYPPIPLPEAPPTPELGAFPEIPDFPAPPDFPNFPPHGMPALAPMADFDAVELAELAAELAATAPEVAWSEEGRTAGREAADRARAELARALAAARARLADGARGMADARAAMEHAAEELRRTHAQLEALQHDKLEEFRAHQAEAAERARGTLSEERAHLEEARRQVAEQRQMLDEQLRELAEQREQLAHERRELERERARRERNDAGVESDGGIVSGS